MPLDQISIGRFSLMTRLSQKALRIYDQREILVPEEKDDFTGYRYYSIRQIEEGIRIKMLASMGFSLAEIKLILQAYFRDDPASIQELFAKRLSETQLEIERLKKIEEVLINHQNTMDLLSMQLTQPIIKEVPTLRVLSKQAKGTYGETIGKLISEIMAEIYSSENRRNFVKVAGPIMFLCHDTGYKEINAHIEVAIPISGRVALEDEQIEIRNLSAGSVASLLYTGSYDDIGTGYQALFEFITNEGLEVTGLTRELYLNSPEQVSSADLLTEIQFPVKRKENN